MRATPYAILYVIPAFFSLALSLYGWQRRGRNGALPFSMLMAALAFWCLCHAASVASTTFAGTLFWSKIQYAGIVAVGPTWLLFALAYAGRSAWATPRVRGILAAFAGVSYAVVLTNDNHYLWWSSVAAGANSRFGTLAVERGPLFWAHAFFAYSCLIAGIVLLIHRALGTSRYYQQQARFVIVGALIPLFGNLAYLLGAQLSFVDDPTPFLLLVSGVLVFYASSRYQLLELAPVAQREVFEHMPDGVVVLDQRGIITSINPSAARILGLNESNPLGKTFAELVGVAPCLAAVVKALGSLERRHTQRVSYELPDGQHSLEVRLQPLPERLGEQAGALVMLRDTTEQVRAEHARDQRLSEVQLLNHIARVANSVVQTEDVVHVVTREIARLSSWHRVVIGVLEADGTTLRLTVDHPREGEQSLEGRAIDSYTFELIIEVLKAGQIQVLNAGDPRLVTTSTGYVLQQLQLQTVLLVPLTTRGQPLGMLFVGDIRAREVSPDELRLFETIGKLLSDTVARTQLYDAAREASNLKSAFLATVSHELRTPLTSIIGFTDMMNNGVFGQLPTPAAEAIEHIQHNSHTLLRLINDILDFSKMESGSFTIDLYPVDLTLVVRIVAGRMQPQLFERGLSLRLELDQDLPPVQANSARLEQVLTNLLANAIKFTNEGEIVVRAARHGTKVWLSVQDTGIGIAPEYQETIFQAFRQIETPLTRRFGGTGLGLAICKRLVELMGGTIWVESEPGVGSTFHCEFHVAVVQGRHEYIAAQREGEMQAVGRH